MGNRIEDKTAPQRRLVAKLAAGAVALCAGAVLALGAGPSFAAQSIDELNSQIAGARQQAQALGAQIDATSAELASAQQQAIVAAQREAQLSAVLAAGEERERRLEGEVTVRQGPARGRSRPSAALPQHAFRPPRGHLPRRHARRDHAAAGGGRHGRPPDPGRVPAPDRGGGLVAGVERALAARPGRQRLAAVEDAQRRAHEFNEQIAAARDQISAVRAQAEARAQQLQALRAQRQAAIDSLQSQVSGWTSQVQRLQRISAQQAQGEVDKWFGDWAIPESIVQCESGGNFGAVNPSSGAGGAYQILPSTWELYGGDGDPQDASPQAQSNIAAQIWADSGSAAWECAQ